MPDSQTDNLNLNRLLQFTTAAPVFIVGAARSGTTAMRMALQDGAGLPGYTDEEQLLNVFPALLKALNLEWERFAEEAQSLGRETLKTAMERYDIYQALNAVTFTFDRVLSDGHSRWVSKAANRETIRALPLWKHLYPHAKFVFVHRHPLKVALSRQRKFPDAPLKNAFELWSRVMEAWHAVKGELSDGDYIEIRQADLRQRTEEVAQRLAAVLYLNTPQCAGVANYLRENRPQATHSSPDAGDTYVEDLDWPDEIKAMALAVCGPMAARWGYQLTRQAQAVG